MLRGVVDNSTVAEVRDLLEACSAKSNTLIQWLWSFWRALWSNRGDRPTYTQIASEMLQVAAQKGRTDMVKFLVETAGADVNWADGRWPTALVSAMRGGHVECMKLLLACGADPDTAFRGEPPLLSACRADIAEYVKLLLKAGADVNKPDQEGGTPLLTATERENKQIMKLLIEAGADVNHNNTSLKTTPLQLAAAKENTDFLKLLLDAGAVAAQAEEGHVSSPLIQASKKGNTECVALLLKEEASVNEETAVENDDKKKQTNRTTALRHAAQNNHWDCVSLLLEAGVDVNHTDSKELLLKAVDRGDTRHLKLFLKAGVDVNYLPPDRFPPLAVAAKLGDARCVQLLLEAGADVNIAMGEYHSELTDLFFGAFTKWLESACSGPVDPNHPLLVRANLTSFGRSWDLLESKPAQVEAVVKLLLTAGANVNMPGDQKVWVFLLWHHRVVVGSKQDSALRLAVAAGEMMISRIASERDPLFFASLHDPKDMSLKTQCRQVIRKHLLTLDSHTNLFMRIPQLKATEGRFGLPEELVSYLLFDQSLEVDWEVYDKIVKSYKNWG